MAAREDEEILGYVFEQFRVARWCLGCVVADETTRRAAIVDPEAEMVEPMPKAGAALLWGGEKE